METVSVASTSTSNFRSSQLFFVKIAFILFLVIFVPNHAAPPRRRLAPPALPPRRSAEVVRGSDGQGGPVPALGAGWNPESLRSHARPDSLAGRG